MKRFRSLSSLGWLPGSQVVLLVVSLATFAVLSRLIAPDAYAQFAVLAFVYTLCALGTDLSAMGYLLVHGDSPRNRRSAWKSASLSAGSGAAVLLLAFLALNPAPLPLGPPGVLNTAVLLAGLVAQALVQPLRGRMMVERTYSRIAVTDVSATILAYAVTILLASQGGSVTVLCAQLAMTSVLRLIIITILSRRGAVGGFNSSENEAESAVDPLAYGLRVMPLNVASYASRSIDSGVLPLILPAAAAATYSRSYQLIVSPVTQVQLSLGGAIVERLARHTNEPGSGAANFDKRLWLALHSVTFVAAVGLSLCAPFIEHVFFGPKWFHVDLMVSSMAALLPALTMSTYMSWKLQIRADLRHSMTNLAVLMLVPVLAIVLALVGGTVGAVIGLAAGALLQGSCLAVVHRKFLPVRLPTALAQISFEWLVLAALVGFRLL